MPGHGLRAGDGRAGHRATELLLEEDKGAFRLREAGLRPRWFAAGGTGLAPAAGTPAEWGTEALRTANEPPDVYVCGPPPLIESVTDSALAGGVPADRIFRERFLPT